MKDCKFKNKYDFCKNRGCIAYNHNVENFCWLCEAGEEKDVNELSPEYDLYGKEQEKEVWIDCCGDVIEPEK